MKMPKADINSNSEVFLIHSKLLNVISHLRPYYQILVKIKYSISASDGRLQLTIATFYLENIAGIIWYCLKKSETLLAIDNRVLPMVLVIVFELPLK